jgi:hypothetical protein
MERGIMMLFHGLVIALVLYLVMVFLLKQNCAVAENRSILMGAVVIIYMILFGHRLPGALNRNI